MASDLDVGMKCIKIMLVTSNLMFMMIGFMVISIGTSIRVIYEDFEIFMESHYFSPASLMVTIGVIIFVVTFFGCFGALKESTCIINMYALSLALILILQVSAAIAAYAMRTNLTQNLAINMHSVMADYDEGSENYPTEAMDFLQTRLQCCGVSSVDDWLIGDYTDSIEAKNCSTVVPQSCYSDENCNVYESGCVSRLSYIISQCAILLGSGALCVAFVQLLGVIFAHMLAKAVRRLKTEKERKKQEARQRFYAELMAEKEQNKKIEAFGTDSEA